MKSKFTCFVLLLILALTNCAKKIDNTSLSIITSFYPIYIPTLNITKDIKNLKVANLTEPQTGCLHDYSFTIENLKTLSRADILIINGAGMEAFISKVIEQVPNLKIIDASKGIDLIKNNSALNTHETGENESELDYNPHVWVSISLAMEQVKNITSQLAVFDPLNAPLYKKNAEEYLKRLDSLKKRMHDRIDPLKNRNIITFHEAFPYFAKEFNLNIISVIEREPGAEPSAKELAETISIIKSQKVNALFAEPQYSARVAETIAKETGLKLFILDPAVTGGLVADGYIKIMEKNLAVIEEALK